MSVQQQGVEWIHEFPSAVTVVDRDAKIIAMNAKACATFAKRGGAALIGKSLYDCHSPNSREMIARQLAEGKPHSYTIEKNGVKKLVHQSPWYRDGELAGLVEISIEIPAEMPHFVRS